ncbi:hypothetical protein K438DRAFT_1790221 [Mycena galopus ATCC 62051]|nr:hypothetical protein K438DRAFT_1790221 [Mycena galopus ATCC 62051]
MSCYKFNTIHEKKGLPKKEIQGSPVEAAALQRHPKTTPPHRPHTTLNAIHYISANQTICLGHRRLRKCHTLLVDGKEPSAIIMYTSINAVKREGVRLRQGPPSNRPAVSAGVVSLVRHRDLIAASKASSLKRWPTHSRSESSSDGRINGVGIPIEGGQRRGNEIGALQQDMATDNEVFCFEIKGNGDGRCCARGDDAAHPGQALARPRKPYEVWAYSMVVFVQREQACGGRKWREEEQGVVTRWWGDKKEWLTTLTASINA